MGHEYAFVAQDEDRDAIFKLFDYSPKKSLIKTE